MTQMLWRQAKALVAARRGESRDAVRLGGDAVELALSTEMLNLQGNAFADLGEVLALVGDGAAAAEAYERALDCYERKGNVVSAERTREKLAELAAPAP